MTHFWRYRECQVPFSCLAHLDSFSAVLRASGPVFMFRAPEHIFNGTVGVRSIFHLLCCRTNFRRYRERRVLFSWFALLDSFSVVPRVLGPVLHVLSSRNSFSVVLRASGAVFMFCAPEFIFDGTVGIMSLFHVLRSQTHFHWYRGPRVSYSCSSLPDSFSSVSTVSGPALMFCAPELIFGGNEGVVSSFHV
jgi:hypothetical protein